MAPEAPERAPLQVARKADPGTISWAEHLEMYEAYAARYGRSQSAVTIARRGGFGWSEFELLLGREPRSFVSRDEALRLACAGRHLPE